MWTTRQQVVKVLNTNVHSNFFVLDFPNENGELVKGSFAAPIANRIQVTCPFK